ncbi:hypothetical protein ruthe_01286 [Rubellimicrobium thermophilum DSM 16684]|uniref:Uncharacterized protein n=1 Tax=Rubellimicrobium thermophilum DSM 16684 TaxID=1123069 RepID=S9QYN2_9RHOB|nr:hypothetical protein [Rubellimicrobium thermophilum]EPX86471.1 hypothetical protein ruthe_01286 [Rubellimicrobium thermophilum DSM 16684]
MSDSTGAVLRRMMRPSGDRPAGVASRRALRIATVRAAERAAGLALSVLGIGEEEGSLDTLLPLLPEGALLLRVDRGGAAGGLIALDGEARSALLEARLLGSALPRSSPPRPPTATDALLCIPFATAFLAELGTALADGPLESWIAGAVSGGHFASLREVEGTLPEGPCRLLRLTLDRGGGRASGPACAAADCSTGPATGGPCCARRQPRPPRSGGRGDTVRRAASADPPALRGGGMGTGAGAAAARRLDGLRPGRGGGGVALGTARLGQMGGRRAIRIEGALAADPSAVPGEDAAGPLSMRLPDALP